MWGSTGGRLATLRESNAPALLPSALALAAAARQAVVVPSRHLVHCGAHRSLAGVCAGIHCAGAAHRHACVWRCILRTAGASDRHQLWRATCAARYWLPSSSNVCQAGRLLTAAAAANSQLLTLARPPMRRISRGDVHTRSHTNTGSADASSSLQCMRVQPHRGKWRRALSAGAPCGPVWP